ncbi:hypothetical protein Rsub_03498 [Raphidocelis subcapitata]|uniref:DUF1618 domain-containing protein n=1 Tax=Raphidocelis subcapitata TaxID=307507 RepID=A0A2V0NV03_9CHLO|nr:hypothetical protein Rsub_03498 [Raphidocelis subcapitata]|eukprot:GBF90502.1 hypothetical protein Rsub_03498 [Raphidocelis subcapitata]
MCEHDTAAPGRHAAARRRRAPPARRPLAAAALLALLLQLLPPPGGAWGAAAAGTGPLLDSRLHMGIPFLFNPSVVALPGGGYMAGARTAWMKGVAGRWWWMNAAYLCRDDDVNFSSPVCLRFDPFKGGYRECMWRGMVDTKGIEDPKLFAWPGRGVFAVFNRKPRAPGLPPANGNGGGGLGGGGALKAPVAAEDVLCPADAPMLQQWLVAVAPSPAAGTWALPAPVPLRVTLPGFYEGKLGEGKTVKEKNWMPLVSNDTLFMVHTIFPQHRVFEIAPDGATARQLLSSWPAAAARRLEAFNIHGGPPVVHVSSEVLAAAGLGGGSSSGSGGGGGGGGKSLAAAAKAAAAPRGYHLGVLHYFTTNSTVDAAGKKKDVKHYYHFLYKMKETEPFEPCALSAELPLVFRKPRGAAAAGAGPATGAGSRQRIWKDTSHTAFVSGFHLERAPARPVKGSRPGGVGSAGRPRVLISYGSSDIESRLLALSLQQVDELFAGQPGSC